MSFKDPIIKLTSDEQLEKDRLIKEDLYRQLKEDFH